MRIVATPRRLLWQLTLGLIILGTLLVVGAMARLAPQEIAPSDYPAEAVNSAIEQLRGDFLGHREPERLLRSSSERAAARQRALERLVELDGENERILAGRATLGVEKHVDLERRALARNGIANPDVQGVLEGLEQLRLPSGQGGA